MTQSAELSPVEVRNACDPLALCLAQASRLLGNPFSVEALTAGLPVGVEGLTPALFARAAGRAGFAVRSLQRPLARLPMIALPAVLLLHEREACILVSRNDTDAHIVTAEGLEKTLPLDELALLYTGIALAVSTQVNFKAGTSAERLMQTHHWFWGTLGRSWPLYAEVALASVLVNVFAVLTPLFSMNVYDRVVPNNAMQTFWVLALGVFLIYLFDLALKTVRGYFIDVAGKRADVALSASLFEQVMAMRLDCRRQSVGTLANNLREFESLREFFTSATMTTLIDLPFVLLFVAVIGLLGGPWMALVPLLAIPVVIASGLALQVPLRNRVQRVFKATEAKHAMLIEVLGAAETVKALGAASQMQRRWEDAVNYIAAESLGTRVLSALAVNFSAWVQAIVGIATLAVGVYLVADREMTTGALVACSIISARALVPLATVASLFTRYHQAMSALAALDEIMKAPREREPEASYLHRPALRGEIRFDNVHFRYPDEQNDALTGFNLQIKAGDKVGIIGRIGSGKSTLARLLLGLYQPQNGSVLIDGIDLRGIDPADLRRNIGYLPQNLVLFAGSVRDNLKMGAETVDDAALLRAATQSGLLDIVNRHPKGFDMVVGERGERLSGGQRQTVALARALINDPPILLLDEPTSSLDHSSEERLKARITNDMADKTVLIVTHRDSLLSIVNTLVIVDGGKLVAAGPRDAVLKALADGKIGAVR